MKNTKPDYSEQILFIGIDVHLKSWVIAIICNNILIKKCTIEPDVKELVKFLRRHYLGAIYYTVYEAGFCGFWIHRELTSAGIKNIVVNAADIPTSDKQKRRKTDKVDAAKLARELSKGDLISIYIPTEDEEAYRILVRRRQQMVEKQAKLKNQIKSLLHYSGIKFPEHDEMSHWSSIFIEHLSTLPVRKELTKMSLDQMISDLRHGRTELLRILRIIRKATSDDKEAKKVISLLQSIPGIGFKVAVIIYSELMDIKRFNRFDKLNAYVGLTPDTDSSGENEKTKGVTTRQKKLLRSTLIEAAWVAIRCDNTLSAKYHQILRSKQSQKVIIIIAKKLLSRIMHVWLKEEKYKLSVA